MMRTRTLYRRSGNVLLKLPIAQRLTLGFLAAALIASLVTSIIGAQRVDSASREAAFYQRLLTTTSVLASNQSLLQFMYMQTNNLLDAASGPHPPQKFLADEQQTIPMLDGYYEKNLHVYLSAYPLYLHNDEMDLLTGAGHADQINQQRVLISRVVNTWNAYSSAQSLVLNAVKSGDIGKAQAMQKSQGTPMQASATAALYALIQFDNGLTGSLNDAAQIEEHIRLLTTIIGAIIVFIAISLVGWFISDTLVRRLKRLRGVTMAVQGGELTARVDVVGRDEIADVSMSVNAMLEKIVADSRLTEAYEQQRQVNRLKDQFILNVSHELRTPLTEVYGYLELLSEFPEQIDEETRIMFLKNAIYGCKELMLLVNNVLDAKDAEGDFKTPELEVVPLLQMVHEVLEHIDPRIEQEYGFRCDIADSISVQADPQHLRQVLRNLLSNAFKYASPHTEVTIQATQEGMGASSQVCISVQDAGPGIPPGELPLLFQKFVRLKRDLSGNVRGTGLGLYISKQLVEAMKGHIWAESTGIPGEGSRFCFTLPAGSCPTLLAEPASAYLTSADMRS